MGPRESPETRRRRYRELLREENARTPANPAQADEEMQALFSALAGE